ncbi:glycoside hydrolase family 16 protein [Neolentinus lepideus HHB14362 ss-1]|uniref:Glycoside hydrolase family 16 protein n=1 Tax=Neolentinus lepideus HHB14362 ss-1 TaxID=1314782 RepID=A0A165VEI4_9AGAM|nr:glycoside hydrolase family 16 protein [Neolentinus lepideus HHB14362 ss-1]
MRLSVHFLSLLTLLVGASASPANLDKRQGSCACGYTDSNGNLWRESVVSDFTASAGALSVLRNDWYVETWGAQHTAMGVAKYNDALGLMTSAYNGNGTTYVAEIQSHRNDILYGTFRMRAQVPSIPGVCFGFFTYKSDTEETDIEFLSSDPTYYNTVHYTNQPHTTQEVQVNGADFTAFGDHRFDWLPSATTFYYNNQKEATITANVPTVASNFLLNVWSDGDPEWTQGPPTSNAIATVQWVELYFNSTSLSESSFVSACNAAGNPAACQI